MSRHRLIFAVISVLFIALPGLAQLDNGSQNAKPAIVKPSGKPKSKPAARLEVVNTVSLEAGDISMFRGVQCDGDGHVYIQRGNEGPSPIEEFDEKGKKIASFSAGSTADLQIEYTGQFTVGFDGTVYQLAFPHSYDRYLLIYDKDGEYKSRVKFDVGGVWIPRAVVPFASTGFLAVGQKWSRAAQKYEPFNGILSSSGTLLKQLQLDEDEQVQAEAGFSGTNRAISGGRFVASDDGNIYLYAPPVSAGDLCNFSRRRGSTPLYSSGRRDVAGEHAGRRRTGCHHVSRG